MKKVWIVLGLLLGVSVGYVTSQVVIIQRPLANTGLSTGVGYGTRVPVVTDDGRPPTDGELFVVRNAGTSDPSPQIYSSLNTAWLDIVTSGGTNGSTAERDVILNARLKQNVAREDFDNIVAHLTEEDFTAAVVTDGGENVIMLSNSQLGAIAYRLEAPDGPGLAATLAPFDVQGTFTLNTFADDVDNEGAEWVFGAFGPDQVAGVHDAVWFDEDFDQTAYCEASITIADISDTDDLWFGWIVKEAYDNPPASDTFDTSALFVISDLAGDLDIETELNGGGTLNDDTAETWADTETHVLRVTLNADTVSFTLNGTAVTQTNAVLNLDAADEAVCVLGYTLVAASDPTVTVDYVEISTNQ